MGTKPKITISKFKDILKTSISLDITSKQKFKYQPILIEGAAGIGKTASVFQVAEELTKELGIKFNVFDFRAGQTTIQDLYGIPMRSQDGNYCEYLKDKSFPGVTGDKDSYGIFFIDELTTTKDEPLLAGLLQLMTDKKIAGYELPSNWYIVCAANRKQDGNVFKSLPFPLRNRLEIYDLEFSKSEWIDYMRSTGVDERIIEYINTRVSIKDFLTYYPELEMIGDDEDETNYVCATPRTWYQVDKKIKMAETLGQEICISNKLLLSQIQALIGVETGKSFMDYINRASNANKLRDKLKQETKTIGTAFDIIDKIKVSLLLSQEDEDFVTDLYRKLCAIDYENISNVELELLAQVFKNNQEKLNLYIRNMANIPGGLELFPRIQQALEQVSGSNDNIMDRIGSFMQTQNPDQPQPQPQYHPHPHPQPQPQNLLQPLTELTWNTEDINDNEEDTNNNGIVQVEPPPILMDF